MPRVAARRRAPAARTASTATAATAVRESRSDGGALTNSSTPAQMVPSAGSTGPAYDRLATLRTLGLVHDGPVLGKLATEPARDRADLLAPPVVAALASWDADDVLVAPIDPDLADTAAFCAAYDVGLEESANCVVVAGKREGVIRYAACVVLATTRADVNGVVRRRLDVRKASFAAMAEAVELTGMEYGGITPIGLPAGWPVLVDARVAATGRVIIGSGIRGSKIELPGPLLARLPGAEVVEDLAR
jgi:prolyl-tRNA editing enzyme YbaK/EbsC (Cys-tRNA(Pro) deacylase)